MDTTLKEPSSQPVGKPGGFIPSRWREALLVVLCAAAYGGVVIFHSPLVTAVIQILGPLAGIFFGPWVGGLTGALGGLVMFGIYLTRGYNPTPELLSFVIFNAAAGVIPALLVRDARNWKSVLYASFLVSIPFFLQYIVLVATGIGEAYFWEGLVHNLLLYVAPVLLLTPLLARALLGVVRQRGWYWRDAAEARKATLTDWTTIFTLATVWGVLWLLIYGLAKNVGDLSGLWILYSLACGLASGLAAALILRRAFPALGWGQGLLVLAGWGVGFVLATGASINVLVNGIIQPVDGLEFILLGAVGGFGLGTALRWAGVFTRWRQALISTAVWMGGMVVFVPFSNLVSASYATRLLAAGLLVGAVGAWGIFWQSQSA